MTREYSLEQSTNTHQKNLVLALILAALFGPFGLAYATVPGAMAALIIGIGLAVFTFGIGIFLVWPISVIWAALAVTSHNKKVKLASAKNVV